MIVKPTTKDNFTIIPNNYIREKGLSLQAIGLCTYILSLPKQWKVNIDFLCKELNVSKNTVYKYLKELIQSGVLVKTQVKDESGKYDQEGIYLFQDADLQCENYTQKNYTETTEPFPKICETEKVAKEAENVAYNGISTVSQNLNSINIDNINKNKKEKYIKRKNPHTQHFILESFWQKKLLALCFQNKQKEILLDTSSLSALETQAFDDFIAYRKERGKVPLSTQKAILQKILKFKNEGASELDIQATIKQSIERGYTGLFFTKASQGMRPTHTTNFHNQNAQSGEIVKNICEEYPWFDFVDITGFLSKHTIKGKKVQYQNGVFSYV